MIRTFADAETQAIFLFGSSKRLGNIVRIAARKLQAIDFASAVEDLYEPPGNRLEKLKGDRDGQWSICGMQAKTGDRYRVCFRWDGKDAWDLEIVDCD